MISHKVVFVLFLEFHMQFPSILMHDVLFDFLFRLMHLSSCKCRDYFVHLLVHFSSKNMATVHLCSGFIAIRSYAVLLYNVMWRIL